MEKYKASKLLKEPLEEYWENEEIRNWHGSGRYYISYIIKRELHIPEENFWPAYWLGKNLWHQGFKEEEIKRELEQYAETIKK